MIFLDADILIAAILIAAIVIKNNGKFATNNTEHFEIIRELNLVNWLK